MNNLVNLMSMVGVEKTLIIACGEYGMNKHIEFNDRIFIYALSGNTLQAHDPMQKGTIQYYIESRECTQVILVGALDQDLVNHIAQNESDESPAAALKFNLQVFLRNQTNAILPTALQNQLLVELHVIKQCTLLFDYFFVRERVENARLQIRGFIAISKPEPLKQIFYNGITYNDIISMN